MVRVGPSCRSLTKIPSLVRIVLDPLLPGNGDAAAGPGTDPGPDPADARFTVKIRCTDRGRHPAAVQRGPEASHGVASGA